MKYTVASKSITLSDKNFVTSGGEGNIYVRNDIVYKIFLKKENMIPANKITELKKLKERDNILIPLDIIYNGNTPIGFTMNFVKNTQPLVRLYSKKYKRKNKVKPEMVLQFIRNLQNGVNFIHEKGIIIVDVNEMNFLFQEGEFITPYFIDTNCYKTPSFPDTAIALNIKDWHTKGYTIESDYYSLSILCFSLFTGFHPYNGEHPDFLDDDIIARMKANVPIFDSKVKLNSRNKDFQQYIPDVYLKWFKEIYLEGKRPAPPDITVAAIAAPVAVTMKSTDTVEIALIRETTDIIIRNYQVEGQEILITDFDYCMIVSPKSGKRLSVEIIEGKLQVFDGKTVILNSPAEAFMCIDNRIYCKERSNIHEYIATEFNGRIIMSVTNTWQVLPKATSLFDGLFHQNVMGKHYLTVPFQDGSNLRGSSVSVMLDSLQEHQLLDARRVKNVIMLLSTHKNEYYRTTIIFSSDFKKHEIETVKTTNSDDLNFIVTSKGILVCLYDGEIVISKATLSGGKPMKKKSIKDSQLSLDMQLCSIGNEVRFFTDNKLYRLSMRKEVKK